MSQKSYHSHCKDASCQNCLFFRLNRTRVVALAIAIRPDLQASLPLKKITIGSFRW